jgi:hypothetical protein
MLCLPTTVRARRRPRRVTEVTVVCVPPVVRPAAAVDPDVGVAGCVLCGLGSGHPTRVREPIAAQVGKGGAGAEVARDQPQVGGLAAEQLAAGASGCSSRR